MTREEFVKIIYDTMNPVLRGDEKDDMASILSDLNEVIRAEIKEHDKNRANDYPDTEADGYVFCGKCGAMKTI